MLTAMLMVATTARADGRPPPGQVVSEVLSSLPGDVRLTSLHWDGARVWVSGDGPTRLTLDGQTRHLHWSDAPDERLADVLLAAGTVSPPEPTRQGTFVWGVEPVAPPTDWAAPLVLQGEGIWLSRAAYIGDRVTVDGAVQSADHLHTLARVAAWSPCLADVSVRPIDALDDGMLAVRLEARALGDLRSAECAPRTAPEGDSHPARLQVRGDWSTVWTALAEAPAAPVDRFTLALDGDDVVLDLHYWVDGRYAVGADGLARARKPHRKDRRALAAHGGTPDAALSRAWRAAHPEDPLPPAVARDKPVHAVLQALDTALVDLRATHLAAVRTVGAETVEVDLDVSLHGRPDAPAERLDALSGLPVTVERHTESPTHIHATLTVTQPVATQSPRLRRLEGELDPDTPPRSPFHTPEGWDVPSFAGDDGARFFMEPLAPFKLWHLDYRGWVGFEHPLGLVAAPDDRLVRVQAGSVVGDARARSLSADALTVALERPQADGTVVSRDVVLPAAAHPPDEAVAPSDQLGVVDPFELARVRGLFPDGNVINIDVAEADLAVLLDLFAREGVPVLLPPDLTDLPPVSLYARDRSVGDLLADLQLVLLPHGLVFDETLVLMRDPERASALSEALFRSERVPLAELTDLPARTGAWPVHLAGVQPFDVLRMYRVQATLAPKSTPQVWVSDDALSAGELVGTLDARLAPTGHRFWVAGDGVVLVAE